MLYRTLLVSIIFAFTCSRVSYGHFAWLKTETGTKGPEAVLYFSEDAHVAGDRMPEKVGTSKLQVRYLGGHTEPITTTLVEADDQVGLRGSVKEHPCSITTRCEYGVYQGFLLTYDVEHVRATNLADLEELTRTKDHLLDLAVRAAGQKLIVTATFREKPVAGVELVVIDGSAGQHKLKTNDAGQIEIAKLAGGLVGIRGNYVEENQSGELNGVTYKGAHFYSTLTFEWPGEPPAKSETTSVNPIAPTSQAFATLPEPITSFGAAVQQGYLYVYGGHIGTAHDHSKENLSQHFRRFSFAGQSWEELPMERPLQGLALVSDGEWVYRIGGMEARNASDEAADMHSVAEFARFNTETKQWERLPDLPQGRSSHDAVVADGQIYVVGGWNLAGEADGTWHDQPLAFDLGDANATWKSLPAQPSHRRALAVTESAGKIYALCGIDDGGEIDRTVDVFDIASQTWSAGPALPGTGMNGFGISAWNHLGSIYVSGVDGVVYCLSPGSNAWEIAGQLMTGRFFHRLVSCEERGILAIGGASRKGHVADIELLPLGTVPNK